MKVSEICGAVQIFATCGQCVEPPGLVKMLALQGGG